MRSGQGSAAPYGLAGSVAASTTAAILSSGSAPTSRENDRSRSTAPGPPNWAAPREPTKYPRRQRPESSNAESTLYTPAKPPGTRSLTTAPRVTTPCRSSRPSAEAWARRVGSCSRSGSSDQRPDAVGGPVRVGRPGRRDRDDDRARGGGRRDRGAVGPRETRARTGASVSLPTRPDQTRSHRAASSDLSSTEPTAS